METGKRNEIIDRRSRQNNNNWRTSQGDCRVFPRHSNSQDIPIRFGARVPIEIGLKCQKVKIKSTIKIKRIAQWFMSNVIIVLSQKCLKFQKSEIRSESTTSNNNSLALHTITKPKQKLYRSFIIYFLIKRKSFNRNCVLDSKKKNVLRDLIS